MTRTGASPRLCAHSPEPFVEVHPADAKAAKLADGGFAKVTTQHGSVILKVAITDGQQRGSIFAPIHWSDATAAACPHRRHWSRRRTIPFPASPS